MTHRYERETGCRRTISLIQVGAYGDVQPGEVG
jgi:hypothetical protein